MQHFYCAQSVWVLLALAHAVRAQIGPTSHPWSTREGAVWNPEFPNVDWAYAKAEDKAASSASPTDEEATAEYDTAGTASSLLNRDDSEDKKVSIPLMQQLKIVEARSAVKPSQSAAIATLRKLQKQTSEEDLKQLLSEHPFLLEVKPKVYPYEFSPPFTSIFYRGVDYKQEVIMDPCRAKKEDCCWDKFGTPEYYDFATQEVYYADGTRTDDEERRRPYDWMRYTDPEQPSQGICVKNKTTQLLDKHVTVLLPDGNASVTKYYNDPSCVAEYLDRSIAPEMPDCWDYNSTVVASDGNDHIYCTDIHGVRRPDCVTIGYTINLWIFQCSGPYADDPQCGTFLELHIPGDERIVSSRKLPPGLMSGYRTLDFPLTYKGNLDRVVCAGDYEIWWVLRTSSKNIIEYKKPFRVTAPACDFNRILDKYTRFFDFRFDVKNSLDGDSISIDDLLDISTTN